MSKTDIRVKEFTKDEFRKVREIVIEWNYEWLNYDLVESSDDYNIDVTFRLVDDGRRAEYWGIYASHVLHRV